MQIFVEFVNGSGPSWAAALVGKTITLDVEASETLQAIKSKIQSQCPGVSVDQQDLYNPPSRLDEPQRTLASLGIESGKTLSLKRKLRAEEVEGVPANATHEPARAPKGNELQECLAGINQAQALMRDKLSAVPEDVTRVLVMGVTGAGKSMLVNALAGNALKVVTVNGTRVVEAVSQLPELKIGHTVQSETTMLGRHCDAANKLVFWDCPGFFDSRGAVQDVVNGFAIDQLLQGRCRIKVLLVIQQSQIMETRAEPCKRQLEKLAALFPNPDQLHAMTTLVITKLDPTETDDGRLVAMDARHQEHLTKLQQCGHDVDTDAPFADKTLGPFLARNSATHIFGGGRKVSDQMVGKPYVIPDVAAIIKALKSDPVQSPEHKIHLDNSAKMLFYNVCRQSTDCESIFQSIVQLCQQLFRNTDLLTVIRDWLQWMNELLRQLSSPAALNRMTDIAVALEHGLPRELSADQIDEIKTKTRALKELQIQQDFCSKVDPGLQIQDPKAALNRLLTNAHQELSQKMKHLEEFEAQQENMKRLSDDLEREQAERKKEHEEQQAKIKSVEASCDQKVSEMKALLDEEVANGKRTKEEAAAALATAMSEQAAIRDREIAELHKKFMQDQKQKQEQFDELKAQHQRGQEESARVAREHNAKMEQMQAEQRRQQQQIEEERQQEKRRRDEDIREKEKGLTYVMLPLYQNGRFVKMCRVHPDDVPDWRREHDC